MVSKLGKKLAQTEAFIARYSKNVSGVSVTRAGALSVCVATASAFLRGIRKNIYGVPWSDGFRLNKYYVCSILSSFCLEFTESFRGNYRDMTYHTLTTFNVDIDTTCDPLALRAAQFQALRVELRSPQSNAQTPKFCELSQPHSPEQKSC